MKNISKIAIIILLQQQQLNSAVISFAKEIASETCAIVVIRAAARAATGNMTPSSMSPSGAQRNSNYSDASPGGIFSRDTSPGSAFSRDTSPGGAPHNDSAICVESNTTKQTINSCLKAALRATIASIVRLAFNHATHGSADIPSPGPEH